MMNEFNEQQPIPNLEVPQISPDELDEMDFSYDGYQVVRGEFFAHLFEPSITFNNNRVYLNMACIRKFPSIDYVQILVNSEDKKLAVRPCNGEEKDSFLWCTAKRKPKQISCRVFWGKIASLLDWNETYRYKLLGKLIKSNDEYLFVFDLTSPEIFIKTTMEDGKPKISRRPIFPEEWQNQFGLPVAEHRRRMQVGTFDGYTVFGVKDSAENKENKEVQNDGEQNSQAGNIDKPEETFNQD